LLSDCHSQTPEHSYGASTSVTSPSDSQQQQPASFLGSSAAGHMLKSVANSSAVTLARGGAAAAAAAGVSGALSFLPNLLQDMVEPSRNFAYINLKVRSLLLSAAGGLRFRAGPIGPKECSALLGFVGFVFLIICVPYSLSALFSVFSCRTTPFRRWLRSLPTPRFWL